MTKTFGNTFDFLNYGSEGTDWETWLSRLAVTAILVLLLDWYQRPPRAEAPTTLSYEPLVETSQTSNPLLDRLEDTKATATDTNTKQNEKAPISTLDESSPSTQASKPKPTTTSTPAKSSVPAKAKPTTSSTPSNNNTPRPIAATTNHHPGMAAFGHWYDVETSLFRVYTLARHDGVQVAPPYVPHSYRGQVPIHLHVTNQTNHELQVYWVDYKGNHMPKGNLRPNHVWTQTTWIDHPWVFEGPDAQGNPTPYLYYIPYKVIPNLAQAKTVQEGDDEVGLQRFRLVAPPASSPHYIGIQDDILPYSPNLSASPFGTPLEGITWTLIHLSRMWQGGPPRTDPTLQLLQKYLTNIINAPENTKYRQLRISSPKFGSVWKIPSFRGLLLAVGFVEVQGYAELGCASKPLSRDRIQELALLSYLLAKWSDEYDQAVAVKQPQGADGFGRAGFGRAGAMGL